MSYVVDSTGTLHDVEQVKELETYKPAVAGSCNLDGQAFDTARDAYDHQTDQVIIRQARADANQRRPRLLIKHFCQRCMVLATWDQLVPELKAVANDDD